MILVFETREKVFYSFLKWRELRSFINYLQENYRQKSLNPDLQRIAAKVAEIDSNCAGILRIAPTIITRICMLDPLISSARVMISSLHTPFCNSGLTLSRKRTPSCLSSLQISSTPSSQSDLSGLEGKVAYRFFACLAFLAAER